LLTCHCGVLPRLISGEMRHEAPVAKCDDVTVHDEHASTCTGKRNHPAETTLGVYVVSQQA
jgi:hypothetical protein